MDEYALKYTDAGKMPIIVKAYTANGNVSPVDPNSPLYPTATSVDTSLVFLGKGSFDYGQPIQTDLLHLLENFANPLQPTNPTQGQLWYKNDTQELKLYNGVSWDTVALYGSSGGQEGDFNMGGYKIINLGDPVNPTDGVNKRYVDDNFARLSGATFVGLVKFNAGLNVSGSTATFSNTSTLTFQSGSGLTADAGATFSFGNNILTNVNNPVNNNDAATKFYVDQQISSGGSGNYLPLAGGTMTGDIVLDTGANLQVQNGAAVLIQNTGQFVANTGATVQMSGNVVQGVGAPTQLDHATNKEYVDTRVDTLATEVDTNYLKLTGGTLTGNVTYDTTSQLWVFGEADFTNTTNVYMDFGTY